MYSSVFDAHFGLEMPPNAGDTFAIAPTEAEKRIRYMLRFIHGYA